MDLYKCPICQNLWERKSHDNTSDSDDWHYIFTCKAIPRTCPRCVRSKAKKNEIKKFCWECKHKSFEINSICEKCKYNDYFIVSKIGTEDNWEPLDR